MEVVELSDKETITLLTGVLSLFVKMSGERYLKVPYKDLEMQEGCTIEFFNDAVGLSIGEDNE